VLINLVVFLAISESALAAALAPGPLIQQQTNAKYLQLQVIQLLGNQLTLEAALLLVLQQWELVAHINSMEIKQVLIP